VSATKLWLPDLNKEIDRPWFIPSEESLRQQHAILTSIFYLVKQGDTFGERLPCVNCQNRHEHITLNCIPKPFNGMLSGLYAYYSLKKHNGVYAHMTPSEQARFRQISSMLGGMPDLSTSHPEMANKMMQDLGLNDAKLGGVSLGILQGIAPKEAHSLERRINDKGIKPRFSLGVPSAHDLYRALDYTKRVRNGLKVHWTS
jgi:hypothetical protein